MQQICFFRKPTVWVIFNGENNLLTMVLPPVGASSRPLTRGSWWVAEPIHPMLNTPYQGLIIKTDSLGNEQWRRYPGSPDYDDCYCIVRNSPDGNYIVETLLGVGQFYNSMYDFSKIRLMKFSNAGNVIWDKTYGGEKLSSTTTQVYVHPNGDIVTCGFYYPGFTDSVDTWGWILKTYNNGDSLWMREHYHYPGAYSDNCLHDLKPTPDGGYILVGQTDSSPYIPQSAWVLKVDSLGVRSTGLPICGHERINH